MTTHIPLVIEDELLQVKTVDILGPQNVTWGPDRAESSCLGSIIHDHQKVPSSRSALWASSSDSLQRMPYVPCRWVDICMLGRCVISQHNSLELQVPNLARQYARMHANAEFECGFGIRMLCVKISQVGYKVYSFLRICSYSLIRKKEGSPV